MAGRQDEIRATVEAAEAVTRDRRYGNGELHYRRFGGSLLRVVVRYLPVPPNDTFVGEVVTAHVAPKPPPKEVPIWP